MATIDVDFEVYKEITALRLTEEMTCNDVLRSLLGLKPTPKQKADLNKNGEPWVVKGVSFPHGTEFRATHKGQQNFALVSEGALKFKDKIYISPSAAANAITGNSVNGWAFWECRFPSSKKWIPLKSLRD